MGSGEGDWVGVTDSVASAGSEGSRVSTELGLLQAHSRNSAMAADRVKAKMRLICLLLLYDAVMSGLVIETRR